MTDNPLDPTDVPPLDGLEDIPANTQIRMSESTMIATDTAKLFERHIMEASGRLTELTMETINGVLNDLRVEREETDEPLDEEDDANG